jgi:hypothetical protein
VESNWVHSALRPPMAYCTSPGWLWWWRNWWNDWQGKPKYSKKTCPSAALSTTNPTFCPDANPGRRGGKPASNRLSYGTAASRDSSAGIAVGYGAGRPGFNSRQYKIFLFTASKPTLKPTHPMGIWGSIPREGGGQSGRGVKLTTHLHLVLRSRKMELYLYSLICVHGIVLH